MRDSFYNFSVNSFLLILLHINKHVHLLLVDVLAHALLERLAFVDELSVLVDDRCVHLVDLGALAVRLVFCVGFQLFG